MIVQLYCSQRVVIFLPYGKIRAELEILGKTIDSLDLLIASQAIANKMILVSDDKAFINLKPLKLENWLRP